MESVPVVDLGGEGAPAHAVRRRAQAWPCARPAWAGCPAAAFWQGWRIRLPAGGCAGRDHPSWAKSMPLPGPWAAPASGCCTAPMPSAARPCRRRPPKGQSSGARSTGLSRPGQAGRGGPPARRGGRFPERHLAGLRRPADGSGPGPLRRVDQPGADATAHAGALAAVARLRAERHRSLLRQRASAARASVACRLRDLCDFDEARRFLEAAPVARPVLFLVTGCAPGERVLIEREIGATAHLSRRHRRRQRLARRSRRLAAARVRRGQADGKQSSPHGRDGCLDRRAIRQAWPGRRRPS